LTACCDVIKLCELPALADIAVKLERARAIAQAELELARVRRAKAALIERASAFGELDLSHLASPKPSGSLMLFTGVVFDPNPSTPRRRCRCKSLIERLKPSGACHQRAV
jgi:hypothetical protein